LNSHLEAGAVAGPGALIAGVEQAVAEQDKVSGARALPRDLVELALLHQLATRADELPVAQPRLQAQHALELVL